MQPPMYSMGEIPWPDTVMWNTTFTIQLFLMFLRISWITCLYSVYFSLYFILMFWSICLKLTKLPTLETQVIHFTDQSQTVSKTFYHSQIKQYWKASLCVWNHNEAKSDVKESWYRLSDHLHVRYNNSQVVLYQLQFQRTSVII